MLLYTIYLRAGQPFRLHAATTRAGTLTASATSDQLDQLDVALGPECAPDATLDERRDAARHRQVHELTRFDSSLFSQAVTLRGFGGVDHSSTGITASLIVVAKRIDL
jgi:hypothetical protein